MKRFQTEYHKHYTTTLDSYKKVLYAQSKDLKGKKKRENILEIWASRITADIFIKIQ